MRRLMCGLASPYRNLRALFERGYASVLKRSLTINLMTLRKGKAFPQIERQSRTPNSTFPT